MSRTPSEFWIGSLPNITTIRLNVMDLVYAWNIRITLIKKQHTVSFRHTKVLSWYGLGMVRDKYEVWLLFCLEGENIIHSTVYKVAFREYLANCRLIILPGLC